jgi:hypothetical protein
MSQASSDKLVELGSFGFGNEGLFGVADVLLQVFEHFFLIQFIDAIDLLDLLQLFPQFINLVALLDVQIGCF